MKKALRWILIVLSAIIVLAAGMISYVIWALPNIPAPDLKVEITPERVERGSYLANHLMGCMDCHARRDWTKFLGPVIPGTRGAGGEHFEKFIPVPGILVPPNITPYHLGTWTDGEIYRAITCGVSKDGRPLFPIMPYLQFGKLSDEDIYSVIAYLRTLEPVQSDNPVTHMNFPLNIFLHLMPQKGTHELEGESNDPVLKGKYLATTAACIDCHTPQEKGKYIPEMDYAGGMEFSVPTGGIVRSGNITPDPDTGIGRWTQDQFLARFLTYRDSTFVPQPVDPGAFNTAMPWQYYASMKEEDLVSIFHYLKSLKPVNHQVIKFSPPESN